jgi:hypothetical protein
MSLKRLTEHRKTREMQRAAGILSLFTGHKGCAYHSRRIVTGDRLPEHGSAWPLISSAKKPSRIVDCQNDYFEPQEVIDRRKVITPE